MSFRAAEAAKREIFIYYIHLSTKPLGSMPNMREDSELGISHPHHNHLDNWSARPANPAMTSAMGFGVWFHVHTNECMCWFGKRV